MTAAITKEQALVPFVTSHEIDHALGGGDRGRKQRGRLTMSQESLPEPRNFGRVKRQNLLMLPRFALGGLLRAPDKAAARTIVDAALEVIHDGSFGELGLVVVEAARSRLEERWSFASVTQGAAEIAPDTMRRCADLVADAETRLEQELGITFKAVFATLDEDGAIRLIDGSTEAVKRNNVLVEDAWASSAFFERLDWRDNAIGLLMPTSFRFSPEQLAELPSRDDLALARWFHERTTEAPAAPATVDDHQGAAVDEYAAPRWRRKRHFAEPLHMTRVPRAA